MSEFPANPTRLDPYKNCRFLLYFGTSTAPVAAVSRVSGLSWSADVVVQNVGNSVLPELGIGRVSFAPIVLSRGLTQDLDFAQWAGDVMTLDQGVAHTSLANVRREVRIQVLNEEGQPVIAFILHRCWPSHYQAVGALDANHPDTLFESLTLQIEGFERDPTVVEVVEVVET